jgi:hypothetical protein
MIEIYCAGSSTWLPSLVTTAAAMAAGISDQLWSMTRLLMGRRCQSLDKNQSQKSPVNFILPMHGLPKIVRDAEG